MAARIGRIVFRSDACRLLHEPVGWKRSRRRHCKNVTISCRIFITTASDDSLQKYGLDENRIAQNKPDGRRESLMIRMYMVLAEINERGEIVRTILNCKEKKQNYLDTAWRALRWVFRREGRRQNSHMRLKSSSDVSHNSCINCRALKEAA